MTEKPTIVIKSRKPEERNKKNFRFTKDMVRYLNNHEVMNNYRQNAWDNYLDLPFPDSRMEAWRRTDLKDLDTECFRLPLKNEYLNLPELPELYLNSLVDHKSSNRIILRAGNASIDLSSELLAKGIIFTDLLTAEEKYPNLVEKIIGKVVQSNEGKFAAMSGALAQNGILLYVPKGVEIDQPLHSILWGPGTGLAYITHILVYLEEGASVTYVHEAASPTDRSGQTFHSGLVEIYLGPSANLKFIELQSWGEQVWNISHERVILDNDSNLEWVFGAFGSHLTKNFSEIKLTGSGGSGRVSGFYFTNHDQHLDHDSLQNHLAPNTMSDFLYKGALMGNSRSVWRGMIYVAPEANKSDGYQANRNLVLSRDAHVDSIPGLEILTDDVRCSHGATVGKLDTDQLFYLLSRGISEKEAEELLVDGFFDPIMQRIPFAGIRERFQQAIRLKMA